VLCLVMALKQQMIKELFADAEKLKEEIQKEEEVLQTKQQKHDEREKQIQALEATEAQRGRVQIYKEMKRKIFVGIRISQSWITQLHRQQTKCLSEIRTLLLDEQARLDKLKRYFHLTRFCSDYRELNAETQRYVELNDELTQSQKRHPVAEGDMTDKITIFIYISVLTLLSSFNICENSSVY